MSEAASGENEAGESDQSKMRASRIACQWQMNEINGIMAWRENNEIWRNGMASAHQQRNGMASAGANAHIAAASRLAGVA